MRLYDEVLQRTTMADIHAATHPSRGLTAQKMLERSDVRSLNRGHMLLEALRSVSHTTKNQLLSLAR
jgi:hypothetical protein